MLTFHNTKFLVNISCGKKADQPSNLSENYSWLEVGAYIRAFPETMAR